MHECLLLPRNLIEGLGQIRDLNHEYHESEGWRGRGRERRVNVWGVRHDWGAYCVLGGPHSSSSPESPALCPVWRQFASSERLLK